jgi:methylthioribose-1-phosphate isomerase
LKNLLPWADKWLADETRPRNQGLRLTLWELQKENIQATLIADNVTAS